MRSTHEQDDDDGLPPPGMRWGAGAQSVLPFLTKSLLAKPAATHERSEPQARELTKPPGDRPTGR